MCMWSQGLIKIRGDQCWRDLTCMNYHYEVHIRDWIVLWFYSHSSFQTQPVPNPLSYYLHQTPELMHKAETLGNHVIELIVPFFIFLPRPFRLICGVLQILFQVLALQIPPPPSLFLSLSPSPLSFLLPYIPLTGSLLIHVPSIARLFSFWVVISVSWTGWPSFLPSTALTISLFAGSSLSRQGRGSSRSNKKTRMECKDLGVW